MNVFDDRLVDSLLAAGLRERAEDVGGEGAFASEVLSAATALPQRRALLRWPDTVSRRTGLVLVAGLLGAGLVSAAIWGGRPGPTPAPSHAAPIIVRNGAILVIDTRVSWWIDSASGEKLTGPGYPDMPEGIQDASFAPDGRRVALLVDGALELFDIETGARTALATCPELGWRCLLETERRFSIDWSPDGRSIAVARTTGLITVDVGTGAITRVTEPGGAQAKYSSPTWSPDGAWIAFEFFSNLFGTPMSAIQYVEAIRPDGSGRHRVSAPYAEDSGASIPSWSADGSNILYLTFGKQVDTGDFVTSFRTMYAMAQPVVNGAPTEAPFQVAELMNYHCLGWCPTFTLSPDGADILLDSGDGMIIIPLDGSPRVDLGNGEARPLAWRPIPISN